MQAPGQRQLPPEPTEGLAPPGQFLLTPSFAPGRVGRGRSQTEHTDHAKLQFQPPPVRPQPGQRMPRRLAFRRRVTKLRDSSLVRSPVRETERSAVACAVLGRLAQRSSVSRASSLNTSVIARRPSRVLIAFRKWALTANTTVSQYNIRFFNALAAQHTSLVGFFLFSLRRE